MGKRGRRASRPFLLTGSDELGGIVRIGQLGHQVRIATGQGLEPFAGGRKEGRKECEVEERHGDQTHDLPFDDVDGGLWCKKGEMK